MTVPSVSLVFPPWVWGKGLHMTLATVHAVGYPSQVYSLGLNAEEVVYHGSITW